MPAWLGARRQRAPERRCRRGKPRGKEGMWRRHAVQPMEEGDRDDVTRKGRTVGATHHEDKEGGRRSLQARERNRSSDMNESVVGKSTRTVGGEIMTGMLSTRLAGVVAVTLIALVGAATPSMVAASDPDVVLDLPAGLACAGFDLRVEIWNNPNRVMREFHDKNGNVVRTLTAGKGSTLSFTNLGTGDKLSLKPNGSVEHVAFNPDGSQTWVTTGHNVLILFPTDVPAGPSTTQYVGRVVFTVDTSGVFTLQSTSGTSTDICAALSP